MPADRPVLLGPITAADIERVAEFLTTHLNNKVSPSAWRTAMETVWVTAPNHGFMLTQGEEVVGVYVAFYSQRVIDSVAEQFCNLGAWCVLEDHRSHALSLLRALLRQPGYTFTDLSPSGSVVPLNRRLRFTTLDTATVAVPNLPWPARRHTRVTSDRGVIERWLTGRDLQIFRDHRDSAAACHTLVTEEDEACYIVFRRDRRKSLPLFASILYVSSPRLFARAQRQVSRHLLLRHRIPVMLAEVRVVGSRLTGGAMLPHPRPRMFKSGHVPPEQIDYLYSELTNVAW